MIILHLYGIIMLIKTSYYLFLKISSKKKGEIIDIGIEQTVQGLKDPGCIFMILDVSWMIGGLFTNEFPFFILFNLCYWGFGYMATYNFSGSVEKSAKIFKLGSIIKIIILSVFLYKYFF